MHTGLGLANLKQNKLVYYSETTEKENKARSTGDGLRLFYVGEKETRSKLDKVVDSVARGGEWVMPF